MPIGVLTVGGAVFALSIVDFVATELAILAIAMMLPLMLIGLLMILFVCTGHRNQPTLFDRKAGKVYIIQTNRDWLRPWRWFRISSTVVAFDWDRLRGLICAQTSFGGIGLPRTDYWLYLAHTDVPNGSRALSWFGVGMPGVYDGGAEPRALWEHIRQFMQSGGPHRRPNEGLHINHSSPSKLWNAMWFGQPLLGPGSLTHWTGSHWFIAIPFGIVMLMLLPLTMFAGVLRWLAYQCKRPASWPTELMAHLGPELSEAELKALSGSRPQ